MDVITDGTAQASPQNVDVDDGEQDIMFSDASWGQVVQLSLTNAGSTDVIEVRSILAISELRPPGELN